MSSAFTFFLFIFIRIVHNRTSGYSELWYLLFLSHYNLIHFYLINMYDMNYFSGVFLSLSLTSLSGAAGVVANYENFNR